jgi:hypothetical protein
MTETTKVNRLAVFGSRTLGDERVRILILDAIDRFQPSAIVTSGEPAGVCGVARSVAADQGLPLTLHFLNFKFRGGAYEKRSIAVYKDCDHCLLIHDGKSDGTANELALAIKMQLPHTYETLDLAPSQTRDLAPVTEREEWTK